MTNYAVLIGNNEFNEHDKLSCPLYDVDGIKNVLTAQNTGLFITENITVLKNENSSTILEALNMKLSQKQMDNLFLLYYSGHGLIFNNDLYLAAKNTSKNEKLLDSTAIPFERIYNWIKKFSWKKVIVILDCCYSGLAGNVFKSSIASQLQMINNKAAGIFFITASSDQIAYDKSENSHYSLFTKHLIAGLETGEADINGDGLVSVDELFDYTYEKVIYENPNQVPRNFYIKKTSKLIIAKSGRDVTKKSADTIEHFVLELRKQQKITTPILTSVLALLEKTRADFSELDKQRYDLLLAVYESNIEAVEFVRQWNKTSKPVVQVVENSPPVNTPNPFAVIQDKMECGALAPKMVYIPAGRFLMGSPENEEGRFDNERQHEVVIEQPFYIGQFAVTFEDYDLFCEQSSVKKGWFLKSNEAKVKPSDKGWGRGQRPVINVTWFEAMAYCEWLSSQTGQHYVLPTEAHWEYACRAGTQTSFSCGEMMSTALANYNSQHGKTLPVGSFPANPWGLYDMHGNVWEWTASEYEKDYLFSMQYADKNSDALRVLRGGSWNFNLHALRSATRDYDTPDNRYDNLGFRLSRM